MKDADFKNLLQGIREAGAYLRGNKKAATRIDRIDPESVAERATFTDPALPSGGIPCVIVGGTVVVRDGQVVEGALPGKAIRAPVRE